MDGCPVGNYVIQGALRFGEYSDFVFDAMVDRIGYAAMPGPVYLVLMPSHFVGRLGLVDLEPAACDKFSSRLLSILIK